MGDTPERKDQPTDPSKEQGKRFQAIFNNAAIGMGLVSLDGRFLEVNQTYAEMLGYSTEELLQKTNLDITHPEDIDKTSEAMKALLQGKSDQFRLEKRYIRADGEIVWGDLAVSPLFDDQGNVESLAGVVIDITENIRALDHLKTSMDHYQTLASLSPVGIFQTDPAGEFLYVNERWCQLAGMAEGEAFGLGWMRAIHSEDRPRVFKEWQEAIVSSSDFASDFRFQTLEGEATWLTCKANPLFDTKNDLSGYLGIIFDITERRRIEQMKDDMLSSVSHEMRTPLTAMLGFADYLLENETTKVQQQEYIGIIAKETTRLKELINNLLDLQRLRAGFGVYKYGPIPVYPMLQEAALLFAKTSEKHRIQVDCAPDLPNLYGDSRHLHRAFENLLTNAIKYSPQGGEIVLGARREGSEVVLWVSDQGLGIADLDMEMIFERFVRLKEPDRESISGTGLGLALVREIITGHKGKLWVESQPGEGSTFFMSLPVTPPRP